MQLQYVFKRLHTQNQNCYLPFPIRFLKLIGLRICYRGSTQSWFIRELEYSTQGNVSEECTHECTRLQCEVCLLWDSQLKSLKVLALGQHLHSVEKYIYQAIYGRLLTKWKTETQVTAKRTLTSGLSQAMLCYIQLEQ